MESLRIPTSVDGQKFLRAEVTDGRQGLLKPTCDSADYRFIVLRNMVKVLLISTPKTAICDPDWTVKLPYDRCEDCSEMNNGGRNRHFCCTSLGNRPGMFNYSKSTSESAQNQCTISIAVKVGTLDDPPSHQGLAHFTEHMLHHGTRTFPEETGIFTFLDKHGGCIDAMTDRTTTFYQSTIIPKKEAIRELCHRLESMFSEPLILQDAVDREIESVDNEFYMWQTNDLFRHNHLLNVTTISDEFHPLKKFTVGSTKTLMNSAIENSNTLLRNETLQFVEEHYHGKNISIVIQGPETLDFLEECAVESFSKIRAQSSSRVAPRASIAVMDIPYNLELFNAMYTVRPCDSDGHNLILTWALSPNIHKNYKSKTLKYLSYMLGHNSVGGLSHYLGQRGYIIKIEIPDGGSNYWNDYVTLFTLEFHLTQKGRDEILTVLEAVFSYFEFLREKGPVEHIWNRILAMDSLLLEKLEIDKSSKQCLRFAENMHLYEQEDFIVGDLTPRSIYNSSEIQECLNLLIPSRANFCAFTNQWNDQSQEPQTEDVYGTEYTVTYAPDLMLLLEDVLPYEDFAIPLYEVQASYYQGEGCVSFKETRLSQNDVATSILKPFVHTLKNFESVADPTKFQTAKEWLLHSYFKSASNFLLMAKNLSSRLQEKHFSSFYESYDHLNTLDFDAFMQFMREWTVKLYMEIKLSGRIRKDYFDFACDILESYKFEPLTPDNLIALKIFKTAVNNIPVGERCLRTQTTLPNSKLFLVANEYFFGKRSTKIDSYATDILYLLSSKFMFSLRVNQQLGYFLGIEVLQRFTTTSFLIYILGHSEKHCPCYINNRIDEFLVRFHLDELSAEKIGISLGITNIDDYAKAAKPIIEHYKKTFIDSKSKISLQIIPDQLPDSTLCQDSTSGTSCKRTFWVEKLTTIGNIQAKEFFASADNDEDKSYFISDLDLFNNDQDLQTS